MQFGPVVGAKVGAEVGAEVGAKVGAKVGAWVGAWVGACVGAWVGAWVGASPLQFGAGALGSNTPVHVAQLEDDRWHHPVPSFPQSPQSASNLQQPPPPGEGARVGLGGVGGV